MKIKRILWKPVRGIVLKWKNYPRYIIEKKIFPSIKNKKVLLVGCAHYVNHYPNLLSKGGNDVYSIDIDPKMAEFGAKKHIIGNVVEIDKHFREGFLDVIFLLGVFGYGLDDTKNAERTMKGCYKVLKDRGMLIITGIDNSDNNRVIPKNLKNYKLFTPISLAGIKNGYMFKRTVFNFLLKNSSPSNHLYI